ncbi:MAG: SNF2-related protein, partial [Candidatus Omnitrophota bacterium]
LDGTTGLLHYGSCGENTSQILERLSPDILADLLKPKSYKAAVLMHVGTNDVSAGTNLDTAVNNIMQMIARFDAHETSIGRPIDVYVALIIPRNDEKNQATKEFNSLLTSRIKGQQALKNNLYLVDMYSAFGGKWSEDYFSDSYHPNRKGYEEMAKAWAKALSEATLKSPSAGAASNPRAPPVNLKDLFARESQFPKMLSLFFLKHRVLLAFLSALAPALAFLFLGFVKNSLYPMQLAFWLFSINTVISVIIFSLFSYRRNGSGAFAAFLNSLQALEKKDFIHILIPVFINAFTSVGLYFIFPYVSTEIILTCSQLGMISTLFLAWAYNKERHGWGRKLTGVSIIAIFGLLPMLALKDLFNIYAFVIIINSLFRGISGPLWRRLYHDVYARIKAGDESAKEVFINLPFLSMVMNYMAGFLTMVVVAFFAWPTPLFVFEGSSIFTPVIIVPFLIGISFFIVSWYFAFKLQQMLTYDLSKFAPLSASGPMLSKTIEDGLLHGSLLHPSSYVSFIPPLMVIFGAFITATGKNNRNKKNTEKQFISSFNSEAKAKIVSVKSSSAASSASVQAKFICGSDVKIKDVREMLKQLTPKKISQPHYMVTAEELPLKYQRHIEDYFESIERTYSAGYLISLKRIEVWKGLPAAGDLNVDLGILRLDDSAFEYNGGSIVKECIWFAIMFGFARLLDIDPVRAKVLAAYKSFEHFSGPQEEQNRGVYQQKVLMSSRPGNPYGFTISPYLYKLYSQKDSFSLENERQVLSSIIRGVEAERLGVTQNFISQSLGKPGLAAKVDKALEALERLRAALLYSDIILSVWKKENVSSWQRIVEIRELGQIDKLNEYIAEAENKSGRTINTSGERAVADVLWGLMRAKQRQLVEFMKNNFDSRNLRGMLAIRKVETMMVQGPDGVISMSLKGGVPLDSWARKALYLKGREDTFLPLHIGRQISSKASSSLFINPELYLFGGMRNAAVKREGDFSFSNHGYAYINANSPINYELPTKSVSSSSSGKNYDLLNKKILSAIESHKKYRARAYEIWREFEPGLELPKDINAQLGIVSGSIKVVPSQYVVAMRMLEACVVSYDQFIQELRMRKCEVTPSKAAALNKAIILIEKAKTLLGFAVFMLNAHLYGDDIDKSLGSSPIQSSKNYNEPKVNVFSAGEKFAFNLPNTFFGEGNLLSRHHQAHLVIEAFPNKIIKTGRAYRRRNWQQPLPVDFKSSNAVKIQQAIDVLKRRNSSDKDIIARANRLEGETTVIEVATPSHFLLYGKNDDKKVYYQVTHIGKEGKIIYIPARFLEDVEDIRYIATILHHDQMELEEYSRILEGGKAVTYEEVEAAHNRAMKIDPFGVYERLITRCKRMMISSDMFTVSLARKQRQEIRKQIKSKEVELRRIRAKTPADRADLLQQRILLADIADLNIQKGCLYEIENDQKMAVRHYRLAIEAFRNIEKDAEIDTGYLPIHIHARVVYLLARQKMLSDLRKEFRNFSLLRIGRKVSPSEIVLFDHYMRDNFYLVRAAVIEILRNHIREIDRGRGAALESLCIYQTIKFIERCNYVSGRTASSSASNWLFNADCHAAYIAARKDILGNQNVVDFIKRASSSGHSGQGKAYPSRFVVNLSRNTSGHTYSGRLIELHSVLSVWLARKTRASKKGIGANVTVVDVGFGDKAAPTTFEFVKILRHAFNRTGLVNAQISLIGVDRDKQAVTTAKANIEKSRAPAKFNIDFIHQDKFDLMVSGIKNADMIVCSNVISHYYTPADKTAAVKKMAESLKADGWLILASGDERETIFDMYARDASHIGHYAVKDKLTGEALAISDFERHYLDAGKVVSSSSSKALTPAQKRKIRLAAALTKKILKPYTKISPLYHCPMHTMLALYIFNLLDIKAQAAYSRRYGHLCITIAENGRFVDVFPQEDSRRNSRLSAIAPVNSDYYREFESIDSKSDMFQRLQAWLARVILIHYAAIIEEILLLNNMYLSGEKVKLNFKPLTDKQAVLIPIVTAANDSYAQKLIADFNKAIKSAEGEARQKLIAKLSVIKSFYSKPDAVYSSSVAVQNKNLSSRLVFADEKLRADELFLAHNIICNACNSPYILSRHDARIAFFVPFLRHRAKAMRCKSLRAYAMALAGAGSIKGFTEEKQYLEDVVRKALSTQALGGKTYALDKEVSGKIHKRFIQHFAKSHRGRIVFKSVGVGNSEPLEIFNVLNLLQKSMSPGIAAGFTINIYFYDIMPEHLEVTKSFLRLWFAKGNSRFGKIIVHPRYGDLSDERQHRYIFAKPKSDIITCRNFCESFDSYNRVRRFIEGNLLPFGIAITGHYNDSLIYPFISAGRYNGKMRSYHIASSAVMRTWYLNKAVAGIDFQEFSREMNGVDRAIKGRIFPRDHIIYTLFPKCDFSENVLQGYASAIEKFNQLIREEVFSKDDGPERMEAELRLIHKIMGDIGKRLPLPGQYQYHNGKNYDGYKLLMQEIFSEEFNRRIYSDPLGAMAYVFIKYSDFQMFFDGNHRTGRFLLNFMLLKMGYAPFLIRIGNAQRYAEVTTSRDSFGKRAAQFKRLLEENVQKTERRYRVSSSVNKTGGRRYLDSEKFPLLQAAVARISARKTPVYVADIAADPECPLSKSQIDKLVARLNREYPNGAKNFLGIEQKGHNLRQQPRVEKTIESRLTKLNAFVDEVLAKNPGTEITQAMFARALGIHPATFNVWLDDHKEDPRIQGLLLRVYQTTMLGRIRRYAALLTARGEEATEDKIKRGLVHGGVNRGRYASWKFNHEFDLGSYLRANPLTQEEINKEADSNTEEVVSAQEGTATRKKVEERANKKEKKQPKAIRQRQRKVIESGGKVSYKFPSVVSLDTIEQAVDKAIADSVGHDELWKWWSNAISELTKGITQMHALQMRYGAMIDRIAGKIKALAVNKEKHSSPSQQASASSSSQSFPKVDKGYKFYFFNTEANVNIAEYIKHNKIREPTFEEKKYITTALRAALNYLNKKRAINARINAPPVKVINTEKITFGACFDTRTIYVELPVIIDRQLYDLAAMFVYLFSNRRTQALFELGNVLPVRIKKPERQKLPFSAARVRYNLLVNVDTGKTRSGNDRPGKQCIPYRNLLQITHPRLGKGRVAASAPQENNQSHLFVNLKELRNAIGDRSPPYAKLAEDSGMQFDNNRFAYRGMRLKFPELADIFRRGIISEWTKAVIMNEEEDVGTCFADDPAEAVAFAFYPNPAKRPPVDNFFCVVVKVDKTKNPEWKEAKGEYETYKPIPPQWFLDVYLFNKDNGLFARYAPEVLETWIKRKAEKYVSSPSTVARSQKTKINPSIGESTVLPAITSCQDPVVKAAIKRFIERIPSANRSLPVINELEAEVISAAHTLRLMLPLENKLTLAQIIDCMVGQYTNWLNGYRQRYGKSHRFKGLLPPAFTFSSQVYPEYPGEKPRYITLYYRPQFLVLQVIHSKVIDDSDVSAKGGNRLTFLNNQSFAVKLKGDPANKIKPALLEVADLSCTMKPKSLWWASGFDGAKTLSLAHTDKLNITAETKDEEKARLIKKELSLCVASFISAGVLCGLCRFGPDMNTGEFQDVIIDEAYRVQEELARQKAMLATTSGSPKRGSFSHADLRATSLGGIETILSDLENPRLCARYGVDPKNVSLGIQGFGEVTTGVLYWLKEQYPHLSKNIKICSLSNVPQDDKTAGGGVYNTKGFDWDYLVGLADKRNRMFEEAGGIDTFRLMQEIKVPCRKFPGIEGTRDALFQGVDIIIPAAVPDVFTAVKDIKNLKEAGTKMMFELANNSIRPNVAVTRKQIRENRPRNIARQQLEKNLKKYKGLAIYLEDVFDIFGIYLKHGPIVNGGGIRASREQVEHWEREGREFLKAHMKERGIHVQDDIADMAILHALWLTKMHLKTGKSPFRLFLKGVAEIEKTFYELLNHPDREMKLLTSQYYRAHARLTDARHFAAADLAHDRFFLKGLKPEQLIAQLARKVPTIYARDINSRMAAFALGRITCSSQERRTIISKAKKILLDENRDPQVRKSAAECLGFIGKRNVLGVLEKTIHSPQPNVRVWVAWAKERAESALAVNGKQHGRASSPQDGNLQNGLEIAMPGSEEFDMPDQVGQLMDEAGLLTKERAALEAWARGEKAPSNQKQKSASRAKRKQSYSLWQVALLKLRYELLRQNRAVDVDQNDCEMLKRNFSMEDKYKTERNRLLELLKNYHYTVAEALEEYRKMSGYKPLKFVDQEVAVLAEYYGLDRKSNWYNSLPHKAQKDYLTRIQPQDIYHGVLLLSGLRRMCGVLRMYNDRHNKPWVYWQGKIVAAESLDPAKAGELLIPRVYSLAALTQEVKDRLGIVATEIPKHAFLGHPLIGEFQRECTPKPAPDCLKAKPKPNQSSPSLWRGLVSAKPAETSTGKSQGSSRASSPGILDGSVYKGNKNSNELANPGIAMRIALIVWIPVVFIGLSFLFGGQYTAFVQHSVFFSVIANIFVGGLSRASGMYARQVLQADGIDWEKIFRWGVFGGIYLGLVVFGAWYWVLIQFVDSVFWKVVLDIVVFAAIVGLPSNFFIHKYLVARDKSPVNFKDTVKDYLRLYVYNGIFWATGLSIGWAIWPQYIVLIAANMGLLWSGILIYFIDTWLAVNKDKNRSGESPSLSFPKATGKLRSHSYASSSIKQTPDSGRSQPGSEILSATGKPIKSAPRAPPQLKVLLAFTPDTERKLPLGIHQTIEYIIGRAFPFPMAVSVISHKNIPTAMNLLNATQDAESGQYLLTLPEAVPAQEVPTLIVTDAKIAWFSETWFGVSYVGKRLGVISVAKPIAGNFNERQLANIISNFSLHEAGHLYGLGKPGRWTKVCGRVQCKDDHCSNPNCIVSEKNTLNEFSNRELSFCDNCRSRLHAINSERRQTSRQRSSSPGESKRKHQKKRSALSAENQLRRLKTELLGKVSLGKEELEVRRLISARDIETNWHYIRGRILELSMRFVLKGVRGNESLWRILFLHPATIAITLNNNKGIIVGCILGLPLEAEYIRRQPGIARVLDRGDPNLDRYNTFYIAQRVMAQEYSGRGLGRMLYQNFLNYISNHTPYRFVTEHRSETFVNEQKHRVLSRHPNWGRSGKTFCYIQTLIQRRNSQPAEIQPRASSTSPFGKGSRRQPRSIEGKPAAEAKKSYFDVSVPNITGNAVMPKVKLRLWLSKYMFTEEDDPVLAIVGCTILDRKLDARRGIRVTVNARKEVTIQDYFPVGHGAAMNDGWQHYHGLGVSQTTLFWIVHFALAIGSHQIKVQTNSLHNAHVFTKYFAEHVVIDGKTYNSDDPLIFDRRVLRRLLVTNPDTLEMVEYVSLSHIAGNRYRIVSNKGPFKLGNYVTIEKCFIYDSNKKCLGLISGGEISTSRPATFTFYGNPVIPAAARARRVSDIIPQEFIRAADEMSEKFYATSHSPLSSSANASADIYKSNVLKDQIVVRANNVKKKNPGEILIAVRTLKELNAKEKSAVLKDLEEQWLRIPYPGIEHDGTLRDVVTVLKDPAYRVAPEGACRQPFLAISKGNASHTNKWYVEGIIETLLYKDYAEIFCWEIRPDNRRGAASRLKGAGRQLFFHVLNRLTEQYPQDVRVTVVGKLALQALADEGVSRLSLLKTRDDYEPYINSFAVRTRRWLEEVPLSERNIAQNSQLLQSSSAVQSKRSGRLYLLENVLRDTGVNNFAITRCIKFLKSHTQDYFKIGRYAICFTAHKNNFYVSAEGRDLLHKAFAQFSRIPAGSLVSDLFQISLPEAKRVTQEFGAIEGAGSLYRYSRELGDIPHQVIDSVVYVDAIDVWERLGLFLNHEYTDCILGCMETPLRECFVSEYLKRKGVLGKAVVGLPVQLRNKSLTSLIVEVAAKNEKEKIAALAGQDVCVMREPAYYDSFDKLRYEIWRIHSASKKNPTTAQLADYPNDRDFKNGPLPYEYYRQAGRPDILYAVSNFGGIDVVNERLGFRPTPSEEHSLKHWNNTETALWLLINDAGQLPARGELDTTYDAKDIVEGVKTFHGGFAAARERMGQEILRLRGRYSLEDPVNRQRAFWFTISQMQDPQELQVFLTIDYDVHKRKTGLRTLLGRGMRIGEIREEFWRNFIAASEEFLTSQERELLSWFVAGIGCSFDRLGILEKDIPPVSKALCAVLHKLANASLRKIDGQVKEREALKAKADFSSVEAKRVLRQGHFHKIVSIILDLHKGKNDLNNILKLFRQLLASIGSRINTMHFWLNLEYELLTFMRAHGHYPGGNDLENIGKGIHAAIGKARASYDGVRQNMRGIFVRESGLQDNSHIVQFLFKEKGAFTLKPLGAKELRRVHSVIDRRMKFLRQQKSKALANLAKAGKLLRAKNISEAIDTVKEALDIMTTGEIPEFAKRICDSSLPQRRETLNYGLDILKYFNHLSGDPVSRASSSGGPAVMVLKKHIDYFDEYLKDIAGPRLIEFYKRIFRLYFGLERGKPHTVMQISRILKIRQSHLRHYIARVANHLARNEALRKEAGENLKTFAEKDKQTSAKELEAVLSNANLRAIITQAYNGAVSSRNAIYAYSEFKGGKFTWQNFVIGFLSRVPREISYLLPNCAVCNVYADDRGTVFVAGKKFCANPEFAKRHDLTCIFHNSKPVAVADSEGKLLHTVDQWAIAEMEIGSSYWIPGKEDILKLIGTFGFAHAFTIVCRGANLLHPASRQAVREYMGNLRHSKGRKLSRPKNIKEFTARVRRIAKQIVIEPSEIEWWSMVVCDSLYKLIEKERGFLRIIEDESKNPSNSPELRIVYGRVLDNYRPAKQLKATVALRRKPYLFQQQAIQFILQNQQVLLADECGLGKTFTSIVAALSCKDGVRTKTLVICPKSAMEVWRSEIIDSTDLKSSNICFARKGMTAKDAKEAWFVLVNYEAIIDRKKKANPLRSELLKIGFDMVVVDEAHRMRNETLQTEAVLAFNADYKLLVSATPLVGRSLKKLFFLLHWLKPEIFGSEKAFNRTLARDLDGLRRVLSGFMLARLKEEVAPDLPSKSIVDVEVKFSPSHRKFYDSQKKALTAQVNASEGRMKQRQRFKATERFMQAAISPYLIAGAQKAYGEPLAASGKYVKVTDLVKEIIGRGEKVVVATRYLKAVEQLSKILGKLYPGRVVTYTGEQKDVLRKQALQRFRNSQNAQILVISRKAGGESLNLQHANNMICVDLPWTYQELLHLTDRVYRLGQKKPVNIYRIIAKDSADEHVVDVLSKGETLHQLFIKGDTATQLAYDEKAEIVARVFGVKKDDISIENKRFRDLEKLLSVPVVPPNPKPVPKEAPAEKTPQRAGRIHSSVIEAVPFENRQEETTAEIHASP